jgi:hypothetical protein
MSVIYYMDNGVLQETKTLVHGTHNYATTSGTRRTYFRVSRLRVTYEVRKFPAIFIVVVLKIQMVFDSYIKRN